MYKPGLPKAVVLSKTPSASTASANLLSAGWDLEPCAEQGGCC